MFFDPHRLRIGSVRFPRRRFGRCPGRRGETFAEVSAGAFSCILKPRRSERNPCCFLPILPSFLPPRGLRPAKPVAAPTSEAPYKNAKRDAAELGWLLRLFISSAGREETPCHFIHSSPVNLSVLLNILRSFRNDRAYYTLCFRRSSLTYSALTYFAQRKRRGKQIFPAQCTARLLIQGYCSKASKGCIVGVFP